MAQTKKTCCQKYKRHKISIERGKKSICRSMPRMSPGRRGGVPEYESSIDQNKMGVGRQNRIDQNCFKRMSTGVEINGG